MSSPTRSIFVFLAAVLLLAPIARAADEDYAAKYQALRDKKAADAEVEALLTEWRTKQADNPEAWVAGANYYFNKRGINISKKKPEAGDLPLKKEDTGEEGSISFPLDPENVKRAADLLEEATKKFSDRLDIWCGLAFIYQESGNFDAQFPVLQKMVAYAKAHPDNLLWMGDKISDPPDKFIPEKLHGYALYYEKKEDEDDDKRFLKVAQFAAEQYPNHPYALNDVALYYSVEGDNDKTREWLEKAHKVDPKDALVLVNLGRVASDMGDDDAAKKYYEEAIKADPKGENAQEAKDALAELKKGKQ
jgi:tetratricopeptide (TPR) repeat protein